MLTLNFIVNYYKHKHIFKHYVNKNLYSVKPGKMEPVYSGIVPLAKNFHSPYEKDTIQLQ